MVLNTTMTMNVPDRFCVKECLKEGEAHKFAGKVKLVLVEPLQREEKWRKIGSAFIAAANIMLGGNLGVMIVFTLSTKLPIFSAGHALLCTVATQYLLPTSILILHSLNGPSALMQREKRICEHTIISVMSVSLLVLGSTLLLFDKGATTQCWHHIHVYTAEALGCAVLISFLTGIAMHCRRSELEEPSFLTYLHKFFGMLTTLLSAITYITALYGEGGCRNTFRLWMHAIGYEAPLFFLYFLVIFYTSVVLFLPGSKFVIRTKYNC